MQMQTRQLLRALHAVHRAVLPTGHELRADSRLRAAAAQLQAGKPDVAEALVADVLQEEQASQVCLAQFVMMAVPVAPAMTTCHADCLPACRIATPKVA